MTQPTQFDGTHLTRDDGTPVLDLGPHDEPALAPLEMPSKVPTRKWLAARVTALSAWALVVLATPVLSWRELLLGLIPIATEAVVSYLTPNDPTPGGVRPAE